jgi:CubicO group peptidase (beta-lactamase class C family)
VGREEYGVSAGFVEPPETTPGSGFVYSDINFIMLGALVEKLSGRDAGCYTAQHIFAPLKMLHTRFNASAGVEAEDCSHAV